MTLSCNQNRGFYLLNGRPSHRKISGSLEAARFGFKLKLAKRIGGTAVEMSVKFQTVTDDHYNIQSRGLETSQDFAVRRLAA